MRGVFSAFECVELVKSVASFHCGKIPLPQVLIHVPLFWLQQWIMGNVECGIIQPVVVNTGKRFCIRVTNVKTLAAADPYIVFLVFQSPDLYNHIRFRIQRIVRLEFLMNFIQLPAVITKQVHSMIQSVPFLLEESPILHNNFFVFFRWLYKA